MAKKITALGHTKLNSASFILDDKKAFFSQLEQLSGPIVVTVQAIEKESTEAQLYTIEGLIDQFRSLCEQKGDNVGDYHAEKYLLQEIAGIANDYRLLSIKELSIAISKIKEFIKNTF